MKTSQYPAGVARIIERALRQAFSRSITYIDVKDSALSSKKGPRGGKMYDCASCEEAFPSKEIAVDHITPVVSLQGSLGEMTFEELLTNVFCEEDNLQVLCKGCHKEKTKRENSQRRSKGRGRPV